MRIGVAPALLRRWRTRELEDHPKAWLGLLMLGLLVVAVTIALVVNSLNVGNRDVQADFAQAAQLETGDQVTVAGVPVGHVAGLVLNGDHITASLSIDSDIALGPDTTAAIKLTTLLGNRYIELSPAGAGGLAGGRIPLAHTTVPYDLEAALSDATTAFDQMDADQIGKAMTELSTQLTGLPQLVPSVMRNVATLSAIIAQRRGQIGQLLTSTSQLTSVIEGQQTNLGALFTRGRGLLAEIQSRRQAIDSMIAATTKVVAALRPLVVDDKPKLQGLLTNLSDILGKLSRHDDLMRNILQILPVPWREWANITGTGPELDANATSGAFVDSIMCALAGQAPNVNLPPYSKDCK